MATKNLWLPDIFIVELCVLRAGKSQREAPFPGISRIYNIPFGATISGLRWLRNDQKGKKKNHNTYIPLHLSYSMDIDKTPKDLTAYVSNEGRIRYKKPMKVTSICNLDIFYFPFDQQNCTLTFSSFLYTGKLQWSLRDVGE